MNVVGLECGTEDQCAVAPRVRCAQGDVCLGCGFPMAHRALELDCYLAATMNPSKSADRSSVADSGMTADTY